MRRNLQAWMSVLAALLVMTGVSLVAWSVLVAEAPAPMPSEEFDVPVEQIVPSPEPTKTAVPAETQEPKRFLVEIPRFQVSATLTRSNVFRDLPSREKVAVHDETARLSGKVGTSLLAGHVSSWGLPGALHDVYLLAPGDRIYTWDGDGVRVAWMVSAVKKSLKGEQPDDLLDKSGVKRLALVTCGGKIITRADGTRHYDSNVIAYAVPVPGENKMIGLP